MREHGAELLQVVRNTLTSLNAGYDAQLELGEFPFPDRTYGGTLYPAGNYRALRILLGGASGRNWWCILFPPLCVIDFDGENEAEDQPAVQAEPIRFESLFIKLIRRVFGRTGE